MKLHQLLKENEYTCTLPVENTEILHITSNAHDIRQGTLFILTQGVTYPTEKLIPLILAKRPLLIAAEAFPKDIQTDIPVLQVKSARRTLAFALFRKNIPEGWHIPIIGITGTNGKTTTASMVTHILTQSGYRVGAVLTGGIFAGEKRISDTYYSMTTPDPDVLYSALRTMKDEGCDYIVMEVSSHALALEKLAPLTFDIGIFLNLGSDHMDFHKTPEAYFAAKARLFLQSKQAIINVDDMYGARLAAAATCPVTTVGVLCEASVMAHAVEDHGLEGFSYLFKAKDFSFLLKQNLPGIYNVYNSLCALMCTVMLGILPCCAKRHMTSFLPPEGRMEYVAGHPLVYIDYAHTPEALKSALKTINTSKKQGQKLILVFGCGGDRDKEKRSVMAEYAQKYADTVIVTTDNNRTESPISIIKDTLPGFTDRHRYTVIMDRAEAIRHAIETARPHDIVLIAGKGHERYTLDAQGYHPFDERQIILASLNQNQNGYNT